MWQVPLMKLQVCWWIFINKMKDVILWVKFNLYLLMLTGVVPAGTGRVKEPYASEMLNMMTVLLVNAATLILLLTGDGFR